MAKICLVSNELLHGGTDSDAAHHVEYLAQLWSQDPRHAVTLLYVGHCSADSAETLRAYYQKFGIGFLTIDALPLPTYPRPGMTQAHVYADTLYQGLAGEKFDFIAFGDHQGLAMVCLQAKRVGLAFRRTTLMVCLHAPGHWLAAHPDRGLRMSAETLRYGYMEAYCAAHADVLVSPTEGLFTWLEGEGQTLAPRRQVLPYLVPGGWFVPPSATPPDDGHLVFFGGLQPCHGLVPLLQALQLGVGPPVRRLTLLSADDLAAGVRADDGLQWDLQALSNRGIQLAQRRYAHLGEAMAFLRQTRAVAVLPYLQGNAPYALLACIAQQQPFLCSDVPGMAEWVAPDHALPMDSPAALARALGERRERLAQQQRPYPQMATAQAWRQALQQWLAPAAPASAAAPAAPPPFVSVCIPYYNKGRYLPETLASLATNVYPSFEVVVMDDGSTDADDVAVLAAMQSQYGARGWRFLHQENKGAGEARNAAAAAARGELLLFFDADDLAADDMIDCFARGMQRSGADCLTCNYAGFMSDAQKPGTALRITYGYVPLGDAWKLGVTENVFGGANLIVKASTYWALGGFTSGHDGCEDWEFLANLTLQGYRLEVVPKNCFFYRRSANSLTMTMDGRRSLQRGVRPYLRDTPVRWTALLHELFLPMWEFQKRLPNLQRQLEQAQAQACRLEEQNKQLSARLAAEQPPLAPNTPPLPSPRALD